MPPQTVVIGENLVDLLVHPTSLEGVIGGGPLNVARTMGRLGGAVSFLSGVSADAFGQRIRQALADDGVVLVEPTPSPRPTTMAVVTMDSSGPSYHFHLQNTASFGIARHDLGAPAALYVGTLGLLVEPMASIGEELFSNAPSSTVAILDPNCRPSATDDFDGYVARLRRMYLRADIVKVSVEDLEYLSPNLDPVAAARLILSDGARLVIITDGPGPVRAVHAGFEISVPVPPTEIVDTVGAGDSLTGGFLTWWLGQGYGRADLGNSALVAEVLAAAIEISRRTCQRAGAQPPVAAELATVDGWQWLQLAH